MPGFLADGMLKYSSLSYAIPPFFYWSSRVRSRRHHRSPFRGSRRERSCPHGHYRSGSRGHELVREAMAVPGVEFVAFPDVYTRRLEEREETRSGREDVLDHRHLLDDKSIDAVIVATPQHLHCEHFVAALDAGKHVYQEKTMAFTVEHAKRMRAAYQKAAKQVVQIGHQAMLVGADDGRRSRSRDRN